MHSENSDTIIYMNIYYGSQSGNCEEISKLLQDRIENECNISILFPHALLNNSLKLLL